jgi:hypothetical protein
MDVPVSPLAVSDFSFCVSFECESKPLVQFLNLCDLLAEAPEEKTAVYVFDDGLQNPQDQKVLHRFADDETMAPRALTRHDDRESGSSAQYCSLFFRVVCF